MRCPGRSFFDQRSDRPGVDRLDLKSELNKDGEVVEVSRITAESSKQAELACLGLSADDLTGEKFA